MKNPVFNSHLMVWLVSTGLLALAASASAQPVDNSANRKPVSRARPQVIYHLPPASGYAAALHSQAKTQSNELPIDSGMPTSLQMSRSNANAAAQQQQQAAPPQERQVRPKVHSRRSNAKPRFFHRGPGRGNPHGHKSHKK